MEGIQSMKKILVAAFLVTLLPFGGCAPALSPTCSGDASADVTCTSNVDNTTGFSWHVSVSGDTPTGILYLQASNDGTNWETVDSVEVSSDATQLWNVSGAQYRRSRIFWNVTSGGTTLTAYHWHKEGR